MVDLSEPNGITEHLDKERFRRRQLILLGIPCQLFFAVGMIRPDSNYILILVIPLLLIVRLFFMKILHVSKTVDDNTKVFLNASSAFRSLRGVRDETTNDRVRIRLRTKYRRMRWSFPILIFEQRWKKTDGQIFLVMGPKFHWVSGGSIFSPSHWASGNNRALMLTKTDINGQRSRYCINLRSPVGLEWTLRFKDDARRNVAFQALMTIRAIDQKQQGPAASSTKNASSSQIRLNHDTKSDWHTVLCVSPSASAEAIKAAYHQAIKKCHPDTVADRSDAIKQAAVIETQKINDAYFEARTIRKLD
jgi:hypothetical protein